jgi:SAM-dependent methyltransferase
MNPGAGTQSYQNNEGALSYLEFINSRDGKIFQKVLGDAILSRLKSAGGADILDAGCGPGWLADKLMKAGYKVKGCDASPLLIDYAKSQYPNAGFLAADITKGLPFSEQSFDVVIFSMAAMDMGDQAAAFANLYRVLKPGGKLISTIVNPYYGYPVGVWKRGLWGFLFRRYPRLKVRPYQFFTADNNRCFKWNGGKLTSYFYTLPEQLNAFLNAGFLLNYMEDVSSKSDDKKYSLRYRLYRFPSFILTEFTKN